MCVLYVNRTILGVPEETLEFHIEQRAFVVETRSNHKTHSIRLNMRWVALRLNKTRSLYDAVTDLNWAAKNKKGVYVTFRRENTFAHQPYSAAARSGHKKNEWNYISALMSHVGPLFAEMLQLHIQWLCIQQHAYPFFIPHCKRLALIQKEAGCMANVKIASD